MVKQLPGSIVPKCPPNPAKRKSRAKAPDPQVNDKATFKQGLYQLVQHMSVAKVKSIKICLENDVGGAVLLELRLKGIRLPDGTKVTVK